MIKTILKSLFKVFTFSLLALIFFTLVMVLWPAGSVDVPDYSERFMLKNVRIINVETGTVSESSDIVIAGRVIEAIAQSGTLDIELIESIETIDAQGKFLMPGLWDMHSHSTQLSPWMHHPLLVAHGVTGVRELSGNLGKRDSYWVGASDRVQWNKEIVAKQRVAPRFILQSSFQLDGHASIPAAFPDFYRLDTATDVDLLLPALQEQGIDIVKTYFQIPPDSYRRLASQAPEYGIHLAGHKPIYIDLEEAIELGQKSFEHARIFFFECLELYDALHGENWKLSFIESKAIFADGCDESRTHKLMQLMAKNQAYWTPTLLTLKMSAFADDSDFINHPNLDSVLYLRKKLMWNNDIKRSAKINIEQGANHDNLRLYRKAQEYIREANTLGVPILVGTDVTDTNNFAGASVHYELMDLVDSGLSPLQALQGATLLAAQYAQLDKEYGSVEVGKKADLIILDQNPLQDISNTQKIHAVLLNGVYYDKGELKKLKSEVEKNASSVHMNVKFLYGMLASPLMRKQLVD